MTSDSKVTVRAVPLDQSRKLTKDTEIAVRKLKMTVKEERVRGLFLSKHISNK